MPRQLLRLVLPSPDRRRILARPNGLAGWILPAVPVDDATAWTSEADDAAGRLLGARTAPVRRLDPRTWELEALERVPAVGTTWIGPDEARRVGADADAVTRWSEAEASGGWSPHLRPGWRREVEDWLRSRFDDVGSIAVLRHWELAALLTVEVAGETLVLKEGATGFDREAAVVAALVGLPGAPEIVTVGGARFVVRWAGTPGAASPEAVARAVGGLQRHAADRVGALTDAGCPEAIELLDAEVPETAAALRRLDELRLPPSVIHGDAHGANAVGTEQVVVIDWSDATVGCPVVDLDLLVGHDTGDRDPRAVRVIRSWCDGFGCDPAPVIDALPTIRVAAAGLAVALHRRRRPELPEAVLAIWDEWAEHWQARLRRLV